MATGKLGASTSSGAGTVVAYVVPTGKTAELNITVYNGGVGQAKVTLFLSPTGTPSATHTIQLEVMQVDASFERTAIVLPAGWNVCYKTDIAGVSVVVNGTEYTSKSNEILSQSLITTNAETVVYDNTPAKAGTVNISVSMVDGSAISDSATCKIYTSTSNAAGGYPMHKVSIAGNGISGFEKTGFNISTTDKIIIVTTGIVGQVANSIWGYSK